ncbi:RNA polymerase sigma factor [Sphingomonas pruni]|uniref:RNA polymerase sigma factor n=1 Tax=Sphingomonas pruni TaxID=40683 RepID=UPI001471D821|nr:sigma-70 family RNA polymerase sigma factor [Sphingomonas pruni]
MALDDCGSPREPLSEGDPLPPEDRVVAPRPTVERLYRSQAPKLLRFFARRGHRDEAEDLTNDSFVRLMTAPAVRDDRVGNAESYLQEVAKNVLRNRARAAFHRSIVDLDLDPETVTDGNDPTALMEARDMLTRTEAALARLPAKTRSIFMAHRLEGATYADLAKTHGLSVKGIDWHMTKAIAHLHRFAGKR